MNKYSSCGTYFQTEGFNLHVLLLLFIDLNCSMKFCHWTLTVRLHHYLSFPMTFKQFLWVLSMQAPREEDKSFVMVYSGELLDLNYTCTWINISLETGKMSLSKHFKHTYTQLFRMNALIFLGGGQTALDASWHSITDACRREPCWLWMRKDSLIKRKTYGILYWVKI